MTLLLRIPCRFMIFSFGKDAWAMLAKLCAQTVVVLGLSLIFFEAGAQPQALPGPREIHREERSQLQAMSEQALYERAEGYRLSGSRSAQRMAYQALLERFPAGPWAERAEYELARLALELDLSRWEESIERMGEVARKYPLGKHGSTAAQYYQALRDPQNLLHLELLTLLYQDLTSGGARTFAVDFMATHCARVYAQKPLLQWIGQDALLSEAEKADLANTLAGILFEANKPEACREVCRWTLENYPEQRQAASFAMAFIGDIDLNYYGLPEAAEPVYRELLERYPESEQCPAALFRLGKWHFARGDRGKGCEVLREVCERWPQSQRAPQALQMLSYPDVAATYGAPKALSSTGEGKSFFRSLFARRSKLAPVVAQAEPERKDCGAHAISRVCERLGVSPTGEPAAGQLSFADMARQLRAAGLSVRASEMSLEALRDLGGQQGRGAILHMRDHFVVLEGFEGEQALLSDSRYGQRRMRPEKLLALWDGYVLEVSVGGRQVASLSHP